MTVTRRVGVDVLREAYSNHTYSWDRTYTRFSLSPSQFSHPVSPNTHQPDSLSLLPKVSSLLVLSPHSSLHSRSRGLVDHWKKRRKKDREELVSRKESHRESSNSKLGGSLRLIAVEWKVQKELNGFGKKQRGDLRDYFQQSRQLSGATTRDGAGKCTHLIPSVCKSPSMVDTRFSPPLG